MSEPRLDGRVVLVTGAGRGIGRAIALRFAAAGADLVINDIDLEAARATVELVTDLQAEIAATREIDAQKQPHVQRNEGVRDAGHQHQKRPPAHSSASPTAIAAPGDVTDTAQVRQIVASALELRGYLDVLVNNAGTLANAPLTEMSDEQWDQVIDVHLGGAFRCARAAAPHLRAGGSIINLSSGAAWGSTRGHANYSAAKAGVIGFTRTLALELAPNVRVNAIAPGAIDSDMTRATAVQIGLSYDEYISEVEARTPLGRLGQPEDIADAACFLASPMASFVTGQVLRVAGGP